MIRSPVVIGATFVVVCAAVVSWIWLSSSEPAVAVMDTPAAVTDSVEPAADAAASDLTTNAESSAEPVEAAVPSRVDVPTEVDPGSSATTRAIVRGRVVLSDGQPGVAADLRLHGWEANSERVIRYGKPVGWKDPIPELDANGSFRFEFEPPAAYQFALDVRAEGHSALSWRWVELAADSEIDVGVVSLTRGCVVEGDVVDADGRPVSFPVRIRLETNALAMGSAGAPRDSFAMVDATTGKFRIDDANPGAARVCALGNDGSTLGDAHVEVTRDAVTRCRIVHSGPDPSRAIGLSARCEKLHVFGVQDPRSVVLSGHPNGPLDGTAAAGGTSSIGGSGSFRWIDLPVGRYSLSIDDPRFLPWAKGEVRTGEVVRAALVGSCSVALTVIDPTTRQPVKPSRVRLRYVAASFAPNEFVLEDGAEDHVDGVYGGIVPEGKTMLIVEADGFAPAEVELGKLEPRTTIVRSVELARGATLRGRVTAQGSTQGRGGVTVRLRSGRPPEPRALFLPNQLDERSRDAVTDADGRFEFDGLMAGPYVLWAERNASLAITKVPLDLRAGETIAHDLVIPASGSLRARLEWRAELPPRGIRVAARVPPEDDRREPTAFELFESIGDAPKRSFAEIADDGTFVIESVPIGVVELWLSMPTPIIRFGAGSLLGNPQVLALGNVTIEADHESTAEFDLGAHHPGFARVRIVTNESELAGIGVCARSRINATTSETRATGSLDALGDVVLGPLLPGPYDVLVTHANDAWFTTIEAGISIRAAETTSAQHEIALHRGAIALYDAQGLPLAHRSFAFERLGDRSARWTTDASGRVELVFPSFSGSIVDTSIRATNPAAAGGVPISWPPAAGELRIVWPAQ